MKTKKVSYFVEGRTLKGWKPVAGSGRKSEAEAARLIPDYQHLRPEWLFRIRRQTTIIKTEVVTPSPRKKGRS